MEFNITLGIPQVIMIGWIVFVLINNMAKHGQATNTQYNKWVCLIVSVIELLILKWGGFFS